jgi:hypothetical protein
MLPREDILTYSKNGPYERKYRRPRGMSAPAKKSLTHLLFDVDFSSPSKFSFIERNHPPNGPSEAGQAPLHDLHP